MAVARQFLFLLMIRMSQTLLGNLKALTFSQYIEYRSAIGTYNRVEAYNSNISTLRGRGNLGLSYYDFQTYKEDYKYKLGQRLLTQIYPDTKFIPVEKN